MPEAEAKERRRALVHRVSIAMTLACFALLSAVVGRRGPALFDTSVTAAVRSADAAWVHAALGALSSVTGGVGLAVATAVLAVPLWRAHRSSAVFLLVGLGGAGVINQLAKWLWERRRPGTVLPEPLMPDDFAFPSGHAMMTMTFALALWLVARRLQRAWHGPVAAAGGVIVLLVGIARVHLGKHYPTDVLGGWALGSAWVLLVHLWYGRDERLREQEGAPEESD